MRILPRQNSKNVEERRGVMLVFVLVLLTIVLVMVVFSVDIAFMQLSRTELRAAVDAAAKAAAGELTLSNGDKKKATARGILAASENIVSGEPLVLEKSDFEFGQTRKSVTGEYVFQANLQPFTAVRVTAEKSASSKSGPVKLFFAPMFGSDTFSPTQVAVAAHAKQEMVLAVDRSHSMAFDDSGVSWNYPSEINAIDFNLDGVRNFNDRFLSYPHPNESRWSYLLTAVDSFFDIIEQRDQPPRVAMVTWASALDASSYEYSLTGEIVPAVTQVTSLEQTTGPRVSRAVGPPLVALNNKLSFTEMFTNLRNKFPTPHTTHGQANLDALFTYGSRHMHGGTNASAGIDAAVSILETEGDPDAKKVIVLMTDGQWNKGRDPVEAAADAKDKNIIIHTVTFLDAAEQTTMIQVAQITGGQHYHASSAAELKAIFEELATNVPVALTY